MIVEMINVEEPGGKELSELCRLLGMINMIKIEDVGHPVFLWDKLG